MLFVRTQLARVLVVPMLFMPLCACGVSNDDDAPAVVSAQPPAPAELEQARDAARSLGAELAGRLGRALSDGGPPMAVAVCAEEAAVITARHAGANLAIRRVSRHPRNRADVPDAWEAEQLDLLAARFAAGERPDEISEIVEAASGRQLRYLRPLVIVEPCLVCHGPRESIDPRVASLLAARYPQDAAVGYAAGDLRGAISVVVDLGATP